MRIILSPSKTKKISTYREEQVKIPQYNSKAQKIAKKIARMSVNDISKKFKLPIDKSKELKNFYKNYDGQEYGHSLKSYDGLAFKNFQSIEKDSIFEEMKYPIAPGWLFLSLVQLYIGSCREIGLWFYLLG